MLFKTIAAEFLKLKRSPLWIIFLIIPCITATMGTLNYANNLDVLTPGWVNLWTQHSLFLCYFFLPALVGLMCSYLWRFEHQRNNWNIVLSQPVSMTVLVVSKIVVAFLFFIFTLLIVALLFIASGRAIHIKEPFPQEFWIWMMRGAFAGLSVISVQSMLSLLMRNFAVPVAMSTIFGILGLLFATRGFGLYFPYSLLQISMNSSGSDDLSGSSTVIFIVMTALYIIIPAVISVLSLKNRDITAR